MYDRMLFNVAETARQHANSDRLGTVHEIQKDKMRVVLGIDPNGQPFLGPWTDHSSMRGGTREREYYKVGQNVRMSSSGGDFQQSTVSPHAPSNSFPAPDHADQYLDSNGAPTAVTHQIGNLCIAKSVGKNPGDPAVHSMWMAKAQQQPAYVASTTMSTTNAGASTAAAPAQPAPQPGTPTMSVIMTDNGSNGTGGGIVTNYVTPNGNVQMSADQNGAQLIHQNSKVTVLNSQITVHAASGDVHINAATGNVHLDASGGTVHVAGSSIQMSQAPTLAPDTNA